MKCKNSCGKRREGSGCQAVREENGERRGRQGRLGGVSRLKVVWRWNTSRRGGQVGNVARACRSASGGGTQGRPCGEFLLATWKRSRGPQPRANSSNERRRGVVVKIAKWRHTGQSRCKVDGYVRELEIRVRQRRRWRAGGRGRSSIWRSRGDRG